MSSPSEPDAADGRVPHAGFKFFLATPVHDGWVHHAYMMGAVGALSAFQGEIIVHRQTHQPASRDLLTSRFLASDATHMLCVDPDLGWGAADVSKLLAADKDFAAGIYARKQPDRAPAAAFLEAREGALIEAADVGAGFLLLTRACVERLVAGYPQLNYDRQGERVCAIWTPVFDGAAHYSADRTFCGRWRALGGRIWVHSQVVLKRYAETSYYPQGFGAEPGTRPSSAPGKSQS